MTKKQQGLLKSWLVYFLTPGNENAWDLGYLIWIALCVEFIWKTVQLPVIDPTSFGMGSAALLAAGAGLQWHANVPRAAQAPNRQKEEDKDDK